VTWSHESDNYRGPVSFTETFSLKGVKWDRDSRITFFAPRKGRFKNRWRVDGQLDLIHQKVLGPCRGPRRSDLHGVRLPAQPRLWYQGRRHTPGGQPWEEGATHVEHKYEEQTPFGGHGSDRKDTLTIPIPR
jgi:hypothetical protein